MGHIMTASPASRSVTHLETVLRILAGVFVLGALLYQVGPLWSRTSGFFQTLPFVSNSIVKVSLLLGICLYAAGDLIRRKGLVLILIIAHAVSVVAMLIILFVGDTSRIVDPGIGGPQPVSRVLWGAIALDGVIMIFLLLLYLPANRALSSVAWPTEPSSWLTPAEQWLRRLLVLLTVVFIIGAIGYETAPLIGFAPDLVRELPFVTNSVVKVSTLAMLCGYVAQALRPRMALVGPIIAVHFVSVVAQAIYLLLIPSSDLAAVYTVAGRAMPMQQILIGAMVLDGVIGVLLFALYYAAWTSRLQGEFFRPLEFRTLTALTEVMIAGHNEAIPPEVAARNVDQALAQVRTERKGSFRIALAVIHYWPLFSLHPPLPELRPALRSRFIRERFTRDAGRRQKWRLIRTAVQIFLRVGHQLSVLGFYNDQKVHSAIQFKPFTVRAREAGLPLPPPQHRPLAVERPWDRNEEIRETEVCVIGSGAGGAIAAYTMAERGHEVLLVERGEHVRPSLFVEDELRQIGLLYQRGMLQISEDFRFNVLQGNCVGGSTTINNAICFAPPADKIERWNRDGAGLDQAQLEQSTEWVRQFMEVRSLGAIRPGGHHPAAKVIEPALARIGNQVRLAMPEPFDANIRVGPDGCYGCGNCNIGCAWDKKLSMLDHTLPLAQAHFPGRVTILAECDAERFRSMSGKRMHAWELLARGTDGRQIRIHADRFIISAGTIASSALLLRSGISLGRPVGKGLSFNMLTPVFAEFPEPPQNSYAGIQMGHYVKHADDAFIIETWFSPPVGLATAMAGWFDEHYRNMQRSGLLVAYGLVVGTSAKGRAFLSPLNGDAAFRFTPPSSDMDRLGRGLEALATVLFEAGARRVLLNTWDHGNIAGPADIARIRTLTKDAEFITLASSHPQGGNAINRDPHHGVVDESFRVHGYDNLYVCDASVFPGSVQVNPQMTVMSLARYAATRIE